jgi:prepilin-type N-terminal cleavage/methylation domain-containing protein
MMREFKPENIRERALGGAAGSDGFSLIEVLISMLITLIVMSAVFGLLSRGQATFRREPEIADMQQTARSALDMVSRDALQAGAGLPVEFPSFTTTDIDPTVGDGGSDPDTIEIIGGLGGAVEQNASPEAVNPTSFSGDASSSTFETAGEKTGIQVGDLVVLYSENAMGLNGYWIMSYVQAVDEISGPPVRMQISLEPTAPDPTDGGDVPTAYQSRAGALPTPFLPVFVTPVTVVRYFTQPDDTMTLSGPPVNALMRQVNFGQANPVAYLEDFQVVYLVGGTTEADELDEPPLPQSDPAIIIQAADVINGVSITVAARSLSENLQGASEGADGNFIRKSFTSNVNPRNIISGLAHRCYEETGQQCWQ